MTGTVSQVALTPGYLLHHQAWRDTGRVFEVLTQDHGRLSLFARGVRGPKSKLAGILQPFAPLLLSWRGRGDAPLLIGAEPDPQAGGAGVALPPACILSGYYLSELVITLTARHDPQPGIFGHYHRALLALKQGALLERELRLFEKRLLDALGYGIDSGTAADGAAIDADKYYHYRPADGLHEAVADSSGGILGATLQSLAQERLDDPLSLEQSRVVLRVALGQCLEGRTLKTRKVARSLWQMRQSA
jgi:DNA repair protein RecO (recombination protein O)